MKKVKLIMSLTRDLYKDCWKTIFFIMGVFLIVRIVYPLLNPLIIQTLFNSLETMDMNTIYKSIFICLIFIFILTIITYIMNVYADPWDEKVVNNSKIQTLKKLINKPNFHIKQRFNDGDIVNRINEGTGAISFLITILGAIVSITFSIIWLLVLAFNISPMLIIIVSIVALVDGICIKYEAKLNEGFAKEEQVLKGKSEEKIYTLVKNIELLRMTNTYSKESMSYFNNRDCMWSIYNRRNNISIIFTMISETISSIFKITFSIFLFPLRAKGILDLGGIVASFSIFDTLRASIGSFKYPLIQTASLLVPIKNLNTLINAEYKNENMKDTLENDSLINVENISLDLDNRKILNNISLHIKEGEKVAIVGKNGSGKSTLLKIISGGFIPTEGNCFINKRNILAMTSKEKREFLSYVPSKNQLFEETSLDNIKFSLENNHNHMDIYNITDDLEITNSSNDFINKLFSELSRGQAQRVNIARGLVHNGQILICDEPTASLDKENSTSSINKITKENRTVVVVTHDFSQLKHFSRIISLENGEIVYDGDYEEFHNKYSIIA